MSSPTGAQRRAGTDASASAQPRAGGSGEDERIDVQPGDSLWLIAARRLGPGASDAQLAAYWPRIYRRNRAVIGDDPDRIYPGQSLRLPATAKESR